LDDLFAEYDDSARERERRIADRLTAMMVRPIVLVGAGGLGERVGAELVGRAMQVVGFADSDTQRQGTELLDLPVMSPEEASLRWCQDAIFIVTIWNGEHSFVRTRARLDALGCRDIVSWLEAARTLGGALLPQYAAGPPASTLAARDAVLAQAHVWADERSSSVYAGQVAWRVTGDFGYIGDVQPDQYFPADVVRLRDDEAFVDCGAYTGDTVVELARRVPTFRMVYAFEPDAENRAALVRTVQGLGVDVSRRVRIHRLVTGSENGMCAFKCGAGASSAAVAAGEADIACETLNVPCGRLDDILRGEAVTFIKMDVEGAEGATLHGSRDILRVQRPLVAVSVYHHPSDLWELPGLLSKLTEGYLLYLRAHRYDSFECVLYGVPEERRV
jgi:FkbM family methyltransferase